MVRTVSHLRMSNARGAEGAAAPPMDVRAHVNTQRFLNRFQKSVKELQISRNTSEIDPINI